MKFDIQRIFGGVLYKDHEIVCIKRDGKYLDVYQFWPDYRLLLNIELSPRTNRVGRYSDGVFYFQNHNTYFCSFDNNYEIHQGRYYYRYDNKYKAYVDEESKSQITFEQNTKTKVPILQQGGLKLFLIEGLVQAAETASGEGLIVYNSLINGGGEVWRHKYSELTKSNSAHLHSRILSDEDKLFFVITGNQSKGLFVLDIKTGLILKNFKDLCYEIFKDDKYIYTTRFENILCRIKIETLEIEEWDCNSLIKDNNFQSIQDHRCDVANERFYFTQTLGDIMGKVGILDWKKRDLVYKHDFEPQNGAIGSILAGEIEMFIHTQDNSLHIFRRV
ncbi:MAG: hypothetical protein EBR30_15965 [Cytophagia bacterium]|nr:hypothetical protein [Cytophagia bacterium]